jgi:hypothetical protein
MEQTTLEKAAKAFADAREKEEKARDHYAYCLALLDKSINESAEASKCRQDAEKKLLEAASLASYESNQ